MEKNIYLTLINREHRVPEDWNLKVDFAVGKNYLGELFIVEKETLHAFEKLRIFLLQNKNIQIELNSTYRSFAEQQQIIDAYLADENKGKTYCEKYVAPVGYSEHHTGLAVDFFIAKNGKKAREDLEVAAYQEECYQIHQYLADFGFILRYPEAKTTITGFAYEPWHIRYISDREIAKNIMSHRLTLEEFIKLHA